MSQTCTICRHPSRKDIDHSLVQGEALRAIAGRHGCSTSSLHRHSKSHLPDVMLKARDAEELEHGGDLLGQLSSLQERTLRILDGAESDRRLGTALAAIREARANVELTSRLTGKLQERHLHLHGGMSAEAGHQLLEAVEGMKRNAEERRAKARGNMHKSIFSGEDAVPKTALVLAPEGQRN